VGTADGPNVANPANIVLEMWSEFHTWPEGGTTTASIENGLEDVKLVFGQSQIGIGKAFIVGDEEASISVNKTWIQVEQRQFLIEALRQTDLAPLAANLPQQAQANHPGARAKGLAQRKVVADRRALLAQGVKRLPAREKRIQPRKERPFGCAPPPTAPLPQTYKPPRSSGSPPTNGTRSRSTMARHSWRSTSMEAWC
jgi:hypothetical protein